VGDIIQEVRAKVQPDKRLSVFRVDYKGEHGDWLLTGEVSSQEALDTLIAELKKGLPQAQIISQVVVLQPKSWKVKNTASSGSASPASTVTTSTSRN